MKSLLPIFFLSLIFFFYSCADEEKDQDVELTFQLSSLESENLLTIEFSAKDNNAGEDSAVSSTEVESFSKIAQYTFTSDSSYEITVSDKNIVIEESDSTYKVTVKATVQILKNNVPIEHVSQLDGKISLKISGSLGDQSLQVSGEVTYSSDPDKNTQENDPNSGNTDDNALTNTKGTQTFRLVSASLNRNEPEYSKDSSVENFEIVKVSIEYSGTDTLSDDELISFIKSGTLTVTFKTREISVQPEVRTTTLETTDEKRKVIISYKLTLTSSDQNTIDTSNPELFADQISMNFKFSNSNNENFEFTSELMHEHDFSNFNAGMNVFLAGYNGNPSDEFSTGFGSVPPGFDVRGLTNVNILTDLELSYSSNIFSNGEGGQAINIGDLYFFTDKMKDSLYTTELKMNTNYRLIGFIACVFLSDSPSTYNQRKESASNTQTDYSAYSSLDDYRKTDPVEPDLHEVFYVGDGRDFNSKLRAIKVPIGASKIYCGSVDQVGNGEVGGYGDNTTAKVNFSIFAY